MIMALEITWENQPTLFLGLGADDRCHIGGRRNVLCKVKTKGNNKDINREKLYDIKIFQISPDDDEHSKDEEKGEGYFCSG